MKSLGDRLLGNEKRQTQSAPVESIGFYRKYANFSTLIVTTVVSVLLMASDQSGWYTSGQSYVTLTKYRTSVQIAVQLISASLGFAQQSVVCQLFNYATRLRLRDTPPTLDTLYAWNSVSAARAAWNVRGRSLIPTILFALATLMPSAFWAGAITPAIIVTDAAELNSLPVPLYRNASNVREWPSEIGSGGPILRTSEGLFSFSPGVRMLGSLLASAASATTVDGSVRRFAKADNTRYTYNGRSYGAGGSAGLTDRHITANPLVLSYFYQENGLRADVDCIHNSSTEFVIRDESNTNIYPAAGYLPNSDGNRSYSEYYGHGSDTIVAIGVTFNKASSERIFAIAAGKNYAALNTTQCTITFLPRVFNVSVSSADRSINVTEFADGVDFAARENLTFALVRQFELIANDQTSLYVSVIGDSFNSSIASYNSSMSSFANSTSLTEATATLTGVKNAVVAVADDLLLAYASAQLMIMNDTIPAPATVKIYAFKFGSEIYIYVTFAINMAIILLLAEEALRTRCWRDLLHFDYTDPRSLIIGSSMGGCAIGQATKSAWVERTRPMYEYIEKEIGKVRVALHENHRSVVLYTPRRSSKELPNIPIADDLNS